MDNFEFLCDRDFPEWLNRRSAERSIAISSGEPTCEVPVRLDEFLAYCRNHNHAPSFSALQTVAENKMNPP
jgi:hypothetical protein